jgi:hypothetical protein
LSKGPAFDGQTVSRGLYLEQKFPLVNGTFTCAFACLQLEFLERKVYRLENNVMLLSSLIGRLLDERDVQVCGVRIWRAN